MNLIELLTNGSNITLTIDIAIFIVSIVLLIIYFIVKYWYFKKRKFFPYKISEYSITVAGVSITIKCDYLDREIAYKSWVEMNTRKIGLEIEKNDVIVEIYNSWYTFFGIIRDNIKEMPGHKLDSSVDLIEKLTEILNSSLRIHLTKWQAKFRKWYEQSINSPENKELSPQEIQQKYPQYDSLVNDLKDTNMQLIKLKEELYDIAFTKGNKK